MSPHAARRGLFLVTLCACAAPAPPPAARALQSQPALLASLEALRRETGVPGLAVAVVGREGTIATAAVGLRRVDEPAPLQASDRFHLGSDTKAMTALLAARLVERGLVSWETTLAEAFPEWRGSMDARYRAVRLLDLLRHRGGVPALTSASDASLLDGIDSGVPVVTQRLALTRNVLHRAPAAAPGERFLYSNAGYVVAGSVLERRAGRPWEELMSSELFGPLKMASCGFGPPARGAERGQPFGHRPAGEPPRTYQPTDDDNPPFLGPAGTVHCSLADWAAFVRANMEPPSTALVRGDTLALLHEALPMGDAAKEEKSAYAMGWGSEDRPWAGGQVLAHDGSNGRNLAAVRLAAKRGLAFLVAVNAGDERANRAVEGALDLLVARYAPP